MMVVKIYHVFDDFEDHDFDELDWDGHDFDELDRYSSGSLS